MVNDEREEHKRILKDVIQEYAIEELSTKSGTLPVSTIAITQSGNSSIFFGLIDQGYVKKSDSGTTAVLKTVNGDIKIPGEEYNSLVTEIVSELCEEGFLTKTKNSYSLNTTSPSVAAKAFHAQKQNQPGRIPKFLSSALSVFVISLVVLAIFMATTGFNFNDDGYFFGDGKVQPWNIPFLSPARGISGEWTGSHFIEANMRNPDWSAEGGAIFDFKQDGNTVTGSYTMEGYRSKSITGTISSSQIHFTDGFARFSGTFTGDTMRLNIETCSLDQYCVDPDEAVSSSSSNGITQVYDGEPGVKGKIVLYKGSGNLMANFNYRSDIPDPNKPIGNYPEGYVP